MPGPRGSPIEDADVQIIVSVIADVVSLLFIGFLLRFGHYCLSLFLQGNDITLVARQPWSRGHGARESQDFEIVFREVRTHSSIYRH